MLGLPVKLAVAMLILAAMTPVVLSMADSAQDSFSEAELRTEAGKLTKGIARAYYGGEGCSVTVEVSLPAGGSLELGGDGGDAYVIRLMSNGEEVGRVYIEQPAVPVLGGETSVSGSASVRLTCVTENGECGISVTA